MAVILPESGTVSFAGASRGHVPGCCWEQFVVVEGGASSTVTDQYFAASVRLLVCPHRTLSLEIISEALSPPSLPPSLPEAPSLLPLPFSLSLTPSP